MKLCRSKTNSQDDLISQRTATVSINSYNVNWSEKSYMPAFQTAMRPAKNDINKQTVRILKELGQSGQQSLQSSCPVCQHKPHSQNPKCITGWPNNIYSRAFLVHYGTYPTVCVLQNCYSKLFATPSNSNQQLDSQLATHLDPVTNKGTNICWRFVS
jgi:hypothetical protein